MHECLCVCACMCVPYPCSCDCVSIVRVPVFAHVYVRVCVHMCMGELNINSERPICILFWLLSNTSSNYS